MSKLGSRIVLTVTSIVLSTSAARAQTSFGPGMLPVGGFGAGLGAVGNVVGDFHSDVVCTNGGMTIFESQGGGRFAAPLVLPTVGFGEWGKIVLVDLDGDTDLDIVSATDRTVPSANIVLRRNLGGGAFSTIGSVGAGIYIAGLAAGDVNGDGSPDIVVANGGSAGTVRVYPNAGNGTLQPVQTISVGVNLTGCALIDVDADLDLDILVSTWTPTFTLTLLRNQGGGVFAPPQSTGTAIGGVGLGAGDFDGDGDVDAAMAHIDNSVVLLANDGLGGFAVTGTLPGDGSVAKDLMVADLDADGRDDIITSTFYGDALIHLATSSGFAPTTVVGTGSQEGGSFGDVDGDGRIDGVFPRGPMAVMLGDGTGGFGGRTTLTPGLMSDAADLNGDGRLDLIGGDSSGAVAVRLALAQGGFGPQILFPVGANPTLVLAGRVDGDAFMDVIVCDAANVRWLRGNGQGGFGPVLFTNVGATHANRFWVGHANADAFVDIVASYTYQNFPNNWVYGTMVLAGDGLGNFNQSAFIAKSSSAIGFGDLDGDGISDLALSGDFHGQVWLSSGGVHSGLDVAFSDIEIFDDDGDGDNDLVASHVNQGFYRYQNLGLGSLVVGPVVAGRFAEVKAGDSMAMATRTSSWPELAAPPASTAWSTTGSAASRTSAQFPRAALSSRSRMPPPMGGST